MDVEDVDLGDASGASEIETPDDYADAQRVDVGSQVQPRTRYAAVRKGKAQAVEELRALGFAIERVEPVPDDADEDANDGDDAEDTSAEGGDAGVDADSDEGDDSASVVSDRDDVEVVAETDAEVETERTEDEINDLPFPPADRTNSEIAAEVEDINDIDTLNDILVAEQADKDRDGATEAIENRIEELRESDE